MALRPQGSEPGLRAIGDSREIRRRAVVLGKIRVREVATRFWLFTFAGFIVFGIGYWQYAEVQLANSKKEVLARQRAFKVAVGDSAGKLRSQLENKISWLARADQLKTLPVLAGREIAQTLLRHGPGIYVRLGLLQAGGEQEAQRGAVKMSGHDGFTSCYFSGNSQQAKASRKVCRSTDQCGPGQYCGAKSQCVSPSQPFDMRWLSEALLVLSPKWSESLALASNEYKVRAHDLALAGISKHEGPIAAQITDRSRFFTAVIDLGEPSQSPEEGVYPRQTAQRRLRKEAHSARVGMWQLPEMKLLVALELAADGRLVGGHGAEAQGKTVERVRGAAQRQANDCALAMDLRAVLAADKEDGGGSADGSEASPLSKVSLRISSKKLSNGSTATASENVDKAIDEGKKL